MNGIEIAIHSPDETSNEVEQVLHTIQTSAEVASALLQGNLGIKEALAIQNFPRHIPNFNTEAIQHVQVFRGGALIHTSSE